MNMTKIMSDTHPMQKEILRTRFVRDTGWTHGYGSGSLFLSLFYQEILRIDFKEKINFYWLGLILVEIIKVKLKQLINPIIGSSWR